MSKNALWFAAMAAAYILGAATGILVIKDRMERKYRKRADEEVESVKEAFERRRKEEESKREQAVKTEKNAAVSSTQVPDEVYERLLREHRYAPEEEEDAVVVTREEFGDVPRHDYETHTIVYFEQNGVFVDDDTGEPLPDEEWESMIGCGIVKHFGEIPGDPDTVYIRNDARQSYYEVVRDERAYIE